MGDAAPTPDFASHPWAGLAQVEFAPPQVTVYWADGVSHVCHVLWLYENTIAIDPVSREATVDPGALPDVSYAVGAALTDDGALRIEWGDGQNSVVHPGWLRSVAKGEHLPSAVPGEPIVWTATLNEPPTFDGRAVLDDDATFHGWLAATCSYGLARLRATPADRGFLARLAARIGPVRGSNFGGVFTVEAVIEPDSTANTGLHLGQHTDLPTRETPPGFQFLHCVENTVAGGASRMTDGLAVVAALRQDHPDEYAALTTLEWVFANRGRDADHRWIGPIIDHGGRNSPVTLRAFYPVRLAPHMAAEDVSRAYDALRVFSRVAHDPRLMISSRFEPGDLVAFDNRRVLHGRDHFDVGGGSRVLTGCYIDHDDVYSRLRVLHRDRIGRRELTTREIP